MTSQTTGQTWQAFRQGVASGVPFILIVTPFGLVFGVAATEAGLNIAQTMAFTVAVIAGAAQLTALQLMTEGAPVFVALLTALAVNLRMAMYSASLAPHIGKAPLWQRVLIAYAMVDQAYACSIVEYERAPQRTVPEKVAFYAGTVVPVVPFWYGGTWAGAALGAQIPASIPLEFAVPIAFLAMIGPMLRTLAHVVTAFVSVVGALALGFIPYSLGILVAALMAMTSGALVETWMHRRKDTP